MSVTDRESSGDDAAKQSVQGEPTQITDILSYMLNFHSFPAARQNSIHEPRCKNRSDRRYKAKAASN